MPCRWWLSATAAVLSLTSACTTAGPGEVVSPSVGSKSPSTPAQTPAVTLSCEIPFVTGDTTPLATGNGTANGTAGFLKLPEGTFRPDPNSAIALASSNSSYQTVASPILPGQLIGDRWWDGPAGRWLPVPNQQVASNGATYVYERGPEVHLVTVATGADRVLFRQPSGDPPLNFVLQHLFAYQGSSVYLSVNDVYKYGPVARPPSDQVGVWQIDTGGAAPRRLLNHPVHDGLMGTDTVLWTMENQASYPTEAWALLRYDLASGTKDAWFSDDGRNMSILGIDRAGRPIIQNSSGIWLVTGQAAADPFYSKTNPVQPNLDLVRGGPEGRSLLTTDSHGVWLGSTTGLFLFDATGVVKVAEMPGIPAGPCR